MADELKIKITLDDGSVREGFLSAEKQAEKSAKKIGQSFDKKGSGFGGLTEGLEAASGGFQGVAQSAVRAAGPIGALTAGIAAASTASFKMALAGEQVNAVNLQFANIATSAGLAAEQFGASIITATQGLIDDEDALQIATKGIIALGDQASKLPAILDAARGVSRALGKDFKATFEDLSTFVENGNARVLRQFGIILDLDKAYAAAAKSIGVATSALNEQQKQQIRANLILDEVPKKFSAAAQSVTPLKDAYDRLKISASNALEKIQSTFAEFVTRKFVDEADLSNVAMSRLNSRLKETDSIMAGVSARIAEIKLDKLGSVSIQASSRLMGLNDELKRLRQEQFLIQEAINDQKEIDRKTQQTRKPEALSAEPIKADPAQIALAKQEQLKRLNDLQAYVSAQDKLIIDSEIKRIEKLTDLDVKLTAQKSLFSQQSILLEQQKNAALSQISEQFSAEKGFSEAQRDAAELATKQNFYLQEQALSQANADQIKSIEDNKNMSVSMGFISAMDGMKLAAQDFANNSVIKFQELGKQTTATIGMGVGKAFNNFGSALKNGADAGKAFEDAIGDTIAGVASQFGDLFIQTGIGKLALSYGSDPTGYALIAAGAALKLIVGLSGAGGSASSAGNAGNAGGGIASSPGTSTELIPQENLQRQEANTAVSVIIQGDVLDSQESGSRIVNLINEAFDKKGVVISQGAVA